MIEWITILVAFQLGGEAFAALTKVPVPGPVCGMAFLFATLIYLGRVPEGLGKVADALLSNLALLFVPAGAGIMLHFKLLAGDWLPLSVALIVSTVFAIALTARTMAALSRQPDAREKAPGRD